MTYQAAPDAPFTYNNPFQNAILNNQNAPDMSSRDLSDPVYQNFTATGRPLRASNAFNQGGFAGGMAGAESFGRSAPNLLPVRFTDNSMISVPVLPHAEPTKVDDTASSIYTDYSDGPIKEQPKSRSRFSLSSSFRRKSSSKARGQDFIIKEMTRGNYLKFYAKDDDGRYIGTEEPAVDCILSNEDDRVKFGRA